MTMGLPNAEAERATFIWATDRTFGTQDPASNPYDWTDDPVTEETHPDVQIPVAVDFAARPAASLETTIGQFDASRVVITILDVDYEKVRGAAMVKLGGNTYDIDFVAPPQGLFEVTVYSVYATARDES
jgi:hypothetical protein